MINVYSRCAAVLTLAVWAALPIPAQPEEEPQVNLRFLFLDETLGEGYSVQVNDTFQKIGSYPYAISTPVTVPPGTRLKVYKDLPIPENPPEQAPANAPESPPRIQIATVQAPDNTPAALVVLWPTADSQEYGSKIYNSDPKVFPEGTVRVINLGRQAVAVALGNKTMRFDPGDSGVIRPVPDAKNRIMTKVAVRNENSMEYLYDSLIVMKADDRVTGIVLYSPGGMRHTLTALEIQEFGEPEPRHAWRMYKD